MDMENRFIVQESISKGNSWREADGMANCIRKTGITLWCQDAEERGKFFMMELFYDNYLESQIMIIQPVSLSQRTRILLSPPVSL